MLWIMGKWIVWCSDNENVVIYFLHVEFSCCIFRLWNICVISSVCGIFVLHFSCFIFVLYFRVLFSGCGIFVLYFPRVVFLCCIFHVVFFRVIYFSFFIKSTSLSATDSYSICTEYFIQTLNKRVFIRVGLIGLINYLVICLCLLKKIWV